MRKTIVALLLCAVAVLAWRAYDRDETSLAFDRFWIDHVPNGPKDKFNIAVLNRHDRLGVFGSQTVWTGQWEAFLFSSRESGKLELVYPATDKRETVSVRARKCNEDGFDYCLELTSPRGIRRYYSKRDWDKRNTQDLLVQMAQLR